VVEHPPTISNSANEPAINDFFIPILPYAVTWALCPDRKPPHITEIVLAVHSCALSQFAQYPNKWTPGNPLTQPLHGRHALP
jgi:hypothetical protein